MRKLASIQKIINIEPIENADNLLLATVMGWKVVINKQDNFKVGDLIVYFEIDSVLPDGPQWSEFMRSRKFRVKTIKLRGQYSQGLIMPLSILGNKTSKYKEDKDVTEELKVIKYDPQLIKEGVKPKPWYRKIFLMKYKWYRRIVLGKKDINQAFPTHFQYIHKTDENRVENMPKILQNKERFIKTQKLDGMSATYILERKPKGKFEFYVCSRNLRQIESESNDYWKMAKEYKIEEFLKEYLDKNIAVDYVCIQGEIVGGNIQKNPHKFDSMQFFVYNFIDSLYGRKNPIVGSITLSLYEFGKNLKWVPIADDDYHLPDTLEELKLDADGPCIIGKGPREGWVYRNMDGNISFKNVSRKYLLKHED